MINIHVGSIKIYWFVSIELLFLFRFVGSIHKGTIFCKIRNEVHFSSKKQQKYGERYSNVPLWR